MALVTNRCEKHGIAYAEKECPQCNLERWERESQESKEFFAKYHSFSVRLEADGQSVSIPFDQLYRMIRVRLFEEWSNPYNK